MALRDYLRGEVAQDYADGLLTRREAVRRLGLLGLGTAAAGTALAGCSAENTGAPPGSNASAVGTTGSAPASGTTVPGGGAPPGEAMRFPGPAGELQGAWASPENPRGA